MLSKLVSANHARVREATMALLTRLLDQNLPSETIYTNFPANAVVRLLQSFDVSVRESALRLLRKLGMIDRDVKCWEGRGELHLM